jgi:hypothetical protein
MGIGSVLIQPQRVRRATSASLEAVLIDDLARTVQRLLFDPDSASEILAVMQAAIADTASHFQDRVSGRLEAAYERLLRLLQPALGALQSLGAPAEDSQAALEQGQQILGLVLGAAQGLTLDRLRALMDELVGVVQNDLGITGSFLEAEVWAFVDGLVNRLEQVPDGTAASVRENRLDAAATLRRVKRLAQRSFSFPQLDAEKLARLVLDLLRRGGLADVSGRVQCASEGVGAVAEAAMAVDRLVSQYTHRSIGAAAADERPASGGQYAWYATWLLQYKYREIPLLAPGDLKDAARLANELKNPTNALYAFYRSQLTSAERAIVDAYGGGDPDLTLKRTIAGVLNRLIQGREVIEQGPFRDMVMNDTTRAVRDEYIRDRELLLFNRMVLEDALPRDLEGIPRSREDRFWHAVWEWIKQTAGWPGDQVRVTDDGRFLLLGDKVVLSGTNVRWQDAPIFNSAGYDGGRRYYRFGPIGKEALEGTAWHSVWANDTIRTVWHLLYIMQTGRAHFIPKLLNGSYDVAHGLTAVIARKPFSGLDVFGHKYLEWTLGLPLLATTLGSIQGQHTEATFWNRVLFWFTMYVKDIMDYAAPVATTSALRNVVLSFMTAYNYGGEGSDHTPGPGENYRELEPFVDAVATGFGYWLASEVKREEYVHPFYPGDVPDRVWALWLGGGLGMGLFAGFVGALIGMITAWAEDWKLLGLTMLRAIPKVIIRFWIALYGLREGDTDGGKFNPTGGAAFQGYPAKKTAGTDTPSPYLLPYAAGKMIIVGQGNQGFFSHNPVANGINKPAGQQATMQSYAYDFAHDLGEEILASRPGTVVAFNEGNADGSTADWNSITIRHDVDDNGNPIAPDPAHDLDVGGVVRRTYALYGHGKQNGVTQAFARWSTPVPTASILNTRVKRGQPIMLADDTGTSFHNHLHMHVLPDNPASPGSANQTYAVPFIFQDVEGDGVCKAGHWYESTNARVT